MLTRGRSVLGRVSLKRWRRDGGGSGGSSIASISNLKRNASNSIAAIKDTYFSTKQVFENHRVVFTVGTSIASVLTAWAGYSLRRVHQSNVEKRLASIENAMKDTHINEHEEIKKIVTAGNVSTEACIATAWTSLIIGYAFGWRGGVWFANRKFRREQLRLMSQMKPKLNRWKFLRRPFLRLRKTHAAKPTPELSSSIDSATSFPAKQIRAAA